VVKGFNEVFSPMVKISSIKIVLSLVATLSKVEQMDVKPTFLHGNLEKENLHETT